MGQKDFKSQWIKEFAVKLCLPVMPEASVIKSQQHDSLNMSLAWIRRSPSKLKKNDKQSRNAERGEASLPRKEHNWF